MSRVPAAVCPLAAIAWTACTVALPYDELLPEEDPASCADGRDNDGDGLRDHLDPQCWPFATIEVQRCAEIAGTSFSPDLTGFGDWTGTASFGTDESGAPVATFASGARLSSGSVLTGATKGTSLGITLEMLDDNASARVVLEGLSDEFGIRLDGRGRIACASNGEDVDCGRFEPTQPVELRVSLVGPGRNVVVGRNAAIDVALPDGLPVDWAPAEELRLTVAAFGPGDEGELVVLRGVTLERPPYEPCERERHPQLPTSLAAATLPQGACVYAEDADAAAWLLSQDAAATWRTTASGQAAGLRRVALAWDPRRGRLRGIGRDAETYLLWDYTSDAAPEEACGGGGAGWIEAGLLGPALPSVVDGLGYAISTEDDPGGTGHEVTVLGRPSRLMGTSVLVRARSLDGFFGSFRVSGAVEEVPFVGNRLLAVEGHDVIVTDDHRLAIRWTSGWGTTGSLVRPSGQRGAFDRANADIVDLALPPAPAWPEPWVGRLFYGRADTAAALITVRRAD